MVVRSKYYASLAPLLRRPSFSSGEARELGVPARALAYFVARGLLQRLARGIYRASAYIPKVDITLEGLALVASTVPNAVICLVSALSYYQLTDEIAREHWVAIPHGQYVPKRPHARIVQMRNISLGRQRIRLGEYSVMIFDRERCIVDAFRYLSREVAIKALQFYFSSREYKPNFRKLNAYSRKLRVNLRPYILAITT